MERQERGFLSKALENASTLFFGAAIGVGVTAFAINQHPVISRIINHEGGGSEAQFTVICPVAQSGHVKCLSEMELADAI